MLSGVIESEHWPEVSDTMVTVRMLNVLSVVLNVIKISNKDKK